MTNKNNHSQNGIENDGSYVGVIKKGFFIAFKTVNHDWCIINTNEDIRKGLTIVNTLPFTNNTVMYLHLSDFDNWLPRLKEIPETIKWPLQQYNDSRSI